MENNNKDHLTIAVPKGALLEETLAFLAKVGIFFEEDITKSRKLFAWDQAKRVCVLQIRPWDVPVYVKQGAADLGIAGLDVLMEKQDKVIKLLNLNYGFCSLVLAGIKKTSTKTLDHNLTVATKYPNSTLKYFQDLGLKVNILNLYGAVELAPITGLSDLITDLTATGRTLKANHLEILDTIFVSSACLIANPISMKFSYQQITDLVAKMKGILKQ